MTSVQNAPANTRSTGRGIALSTLFGGLVAAAANAIVAVAALAAGASHHSMGLTTPAFVVLSILGVLGGAIGWSVVRRVAKRPERVLAVLVPVVLLLSLIPTVGSAASMGGDGAVTSAVGLGLMHFIAVAVAIPVYRRFLPLR